MKLLWILLPLALILLPLSKLKLSASEKHSINLRNRALNLGLKVEFASHPQAKKDSYAQPKTAKALLRYQLIHSEQLKLIYKNKPKFSWARNHSSFANEDPWLFEPFKIYAYSEKFEAEILPLLQLLPASAEALEVSEEYVACYWREDGGEQDVSQIALSLEQVASLLTAKHAELYEKSKKIA